MQEGISERRNQLMGKIVWWNKVVLRVMFVSSVVVFGLTVVVVIGKVVCRVLWGIERPLYEWRLLLTDVLFFVSVFCFGNIDVPTKKAKIYRCIGTTAAGNFAMSLIVVMLDLADIIEYQEYWQFGLCAVSILTAIFAVFVQVRTNALYKKCWK